MPFAIHLIHARESLRLSEIRSSRWILVSAIFVLSAIVTLAGIIHLHATWPSPSISARRVLQPAVPDTALGMRVKTQENGLLVSWSRQMPVVRSAKNGLLTIDDGPQQRRMNLAPSEISNGSILYTPVSGDVTFRLKVQGNREPPATDIVRVLKGSAFGSSATIGVSRGADATERGRSVGPKGPLSRSEQQRAAARNSKSTEMARTGTIQNLSRAELPLASLESPVSNPDARTSPVYVPPRPLKKAMPDTKLFRPSVRYAPAQIDVQITIDQNGKVVGAFVSKTGTNASGPPVVLAIAAAKQWIFEPAKMDGKSIPADYTIQFHFYPEVP
jgi:hypothetical protein